MASTHAQLRPQVWPVPLAAAPTHTRTHARTHALPHAHLAAQEFAFKTLFMRAEVMLTLERISNECDQVAARSMFKLNYTDPVRVSEFEQAQVSHTQGVRMYVDESWVVGMKTIIMTGLGRVDKGWFKLDESQMEVYQMSKLKQFFSQVPQRPCTAAPLHAPSALAHGLACAVPGPALARPL